MNKKDQPKIIALVLAVLVVFGLIGKTLMGASGGSAPAAPVAEQIGAPAPAASKGLVASNVTPATSTGEKAFPTGPMSAINPFRQVAVNTPRAPRATSTFRPVRPTRNFDVGAELPYTEGGAIAVAPQVVEVTFKVDGILSGKDAMVVISQGENHFFLRKGQSSRGGFVVEDIQANQVTLRAGKRKMTLTIGDTFTPFASA